MKKQTTKISLATLGMLFFSLTVTAQKVSLDEKKYRKYDLNGDGIVSVTEYKAATRKKPIPTEVLIKNFKKMDVNGNGSITLEEYTVDLRRSRIEN